METFTSKNTSVPKIKKYSYVLKIKKDYCCPLKKEPNAFHYLKEKC